MALKPCLTCGKLTRLGSHCDLHQGRQSRSPTTRAQRDGTGDHARNRRATLQRDHHACAVCGSRRDIEVHHRIRIADGGNHDLHNLVTLCRACHADAHRPPR